jgi:hypothetical protein
MTTASKVLKSKSSDLSLRKNILIGAVTTLIVQSGEQIVGKVAKHPLLVFGLGMLTGGFVYNNRKTLLKAGNLVIDSSKKTVQAQKENLLDLIAEVKEEQ